MFVDFLVFIVFYAFSQSLTAVWLCSLLDIFKSRHPSPNAKVVKNICLLCGASPYGVPNYQQCYEPLHHSGNKAGVDAGSMEITCTWKNGILCLLSSPTKVCTYVRMYNTYSMYILCEQTRCISIIYSRKCVYLIF